MKGWEFTGTHQPLKIVEKQDPKAKPGYVVLKTLAGGLCHSDVSALDIESWMPQFNVPVIMGHEVCGRVVMTCCMADLQFMSFELNGYSSGGDSKDVNNISGVGNSWVTIDAYAKTFSNIYGQKKLLLAVDRIYKAAPPEAPILDGRQ